MERVKIELEYLFRTSPNVLYQFFTTPDRLIRWFCDEVTVDENTYTFGWEGSYEDGELIEDIEEEMVRFRLEDTHDEEEYCEFNLSRSPVTGETILIIYDFCDKDDQDGQRELWNNQIKELKIATGEGI